MDKVTVTCDAKDFPLETILQLDANRIAAEMVHKAIDNTVWDEVDYPGIKEKLHKVVDDYKKKQDKELAKDIYQRGLNDAWEAAKKVVLNPDKGGLDIQELNEVFNCATIQQVFRRYTLSEVIAKLKAYEEKRKADEEIGHDIGKWKDIVEGIECAYGTCGTCGTRIPMAYKYYEYCPHCGTKNEVTT